MIGQACQQACDARRPLAHPICYDGRVALVSNYIRIASLVVTIRGVCMRTFTRRNKLLLLSIVFLEIDGLQKCRSA